MDTQEPALRRGERPGGPLWGIDAQDGTLTTWTNDALREAAAHTIPGNYQAYYAAIRDAVREGTRNPVTPQEGLAVVQVLELACKSSRERRELPFPK
jgi:scyllo-inositol 2-dehydrogenase (NADP+)